MSFHEQQARAFLKQAHEAKDQPTADWFMRAAVRAADKAGTTVEAIEAASKQRCPHYATIKAFFRNAAHAGLDVSKASRDRCRGAVSCYLRRRVDSRSALSAAEWEVCARAVSEGRLVW